MSARRRMTPEEIERKVRDLGPWFHNMELRGVPTAPDHFLGDYPRNKFARFAAAIPSDLTGKSVLDVGCNGGFYAMEMKRRGAARVVAIDSDPEYLEQARFAAEVEELPIDFRQMSVFDVPKLRETFDVVLFLGVLYHLRYPLLALDLLHEHVVSDLLVFQSMQRGSEDVEEPEEDYDFSVEDVFENPGWPKMFFVERRYAHDPTNWWIPNRACAEAMLRAAGFVIEGHPEAEVYVCRRGPRPERPRLLSGEAR